MVLKEGQGQGLTSLEFINNQIQTSTETYILSKTVRPTSSQSQKNQRPILMNGRAFSKIKKKKPAFCRFKEAKQHSDYRQDAAKRQTAGIKFTHTPKIRVFATQGRLVAPIHVKPGRADGHLGPLGCTKFHLNRQRGGNAAPKISTISTFW